jgi:hypothetical protein
MGYNIYKTTARQLPYLAVSSTLAISCTEDRNTTYTNVAVNISGQPIIIALRDIT